MKKGFIISIFTLFFITVVANSILIKKRQSMKQLQVSSKQEETKFVNNLQAKNNYRVADKTLELNSNNNDYLLNNSKENYKQELSYSDEDDKKVKPKNDIYTASVDGVNKLKMRKSVKSQIKKNISTEQVEEVIKENNNSDNDEVENKSSESNFTESRREIINELENLIDRMYDENQ